jgi:hypothetical protein
LLGVGIDWAESFHDVALGRPGEGVIEQFRIEHSPAGVARLVARVWSLNPTRPRYASCSRPATVCWSKR